MILGRWGLIPVLDVIIFNGPGKADILHLGTYQDITVSYDNDNPEIYFSYYLDAIYITVGRYQYVKVGIN